jgi:cytochrome c
MKSIVVSMITVAGLMVAGSAMAVDMPADAAACKACHAIDKKLIGPSWNDVAAKYKGDKGAVNKLVANIKKGGQFGWKAATPMLPKGGTNKTDAEIKKLAEFIVGLK